MNKYSSLALTGNDTFNFLNIKTVQKPRRWVNSIADLLTLSFKKDEWMVDNSIEYFSLSSLGICLIISLSVGMHDVQLSRKLLSRLSQGRFKKPEGSPFSLCIATAHIMIHLMPGYLLIYKCYAKSKYLLPTFRIFWIRHSDYGLLCRISDNHF